MSILSFNYQKLKMLKVELWKDLKRKLVMRSNTEYIDFSRFVFFEVKQFTSLARNFVNAFIS